MCSYLFSALAIAVPMWAAEQAPESESRVHYEIEGRVVESGVASGVYGAKITLEHYKGSPVSSFDERESAGTVETAIDGSFAIHLKSSGTYRLTVEKEGYVAPGGTVQAANWLTKEISLDAEKPAGKVNFTLARPCEVSGSVVDGDTEQPVSGLQVNVLQFNYVRGRVIFWPGGLATTDAKGRFRVPDLPPTEFVIALQSRFQSPGFLQANPEIKGQPAVLSDFSDKDLKSGDYDYNATYWPGGPFALDAYPFPVASGEHRDLGEVSIRKTHSYRVRVGFLSELCRPGEQRSLAVKRLPVPMMESTGKVPCGQDVLARGFAPGSYLLAVESGDGESTPRKGRVEFTIVDRNIEVTIPLSEGLDLHGKVSVPDGKARPDLSGMRIGLLPRFTHMENDPAFPDASGKFVVHNVQTREFQLQIADVPSGHYIKEIRYNGRLLGSDVLAMDGYADAQSLEIILGDKPAAVDGAATDDSKPVERACVILARWPPITRELFDSVSQVIADQKGRFHFASLAPGEYRILAVRAEDKATLDNPNVLPRMLERAEKVSLDERASRTLDVKVARP